jgi:chromosome segregation ATPase
MTQVTSPPPDVAQLDALESDARSRIGELEQEEGRLALDALSDDRLASELADVQSERRSAEDSLRQAALARAEIARRAQQAEDSAESDRVEREMAKARALALEYRECAAKVDAATESYCAALAELATVYRDLEMTTQRAGEKALRPADSAIMASLVYYLRRAGVPGSFIQLGGIAPRAQPLVDSLPRQPAEPLGR